MPNRIAKISAARTGAALITSYVGETGLLFYDIGTGNLRISDGVTPGGQPLALSTANFVAGDFKFISNTASMVNLNENMNLLANGTGVVNIVGPLNLFGAAGLTSQSYFSATAQGEVKIVDLLPSSLRAALTVTGNSDGTFVEPQNQGVMIHTTGTPGVASRIYNDGNASYSGYFGRRYNGSSTGPTQVINTQEIFRLGATPYTNTGWPAASTARIQFIATENQTSTAQGNQIVFATTAIGSTTVTPVATIDSNGIYPSSDNTYYLGSAGKRWKGLNLGPGTLYITDQTLNTQVGLSVNNGVLLVNGANQLQVGQLKFIDNTIQSTTSSTNIQIGYTGDTGNITLNRNLVLASSGIGITFYDSTTQLSAGIVVAQKGVPNGVATLDATGKVPTSQLSLTGALIYKGSWDANTNTPTLSASLPAGVVTGWEYAISATGTRNIGSGSVTYAQGGFVVYNGATWDYIPPVTGVSSINGSLTGAVTGIVTTADTGTVTSTMLAGSIANAKLANSSVTVTGGTGLGVSGSPVSLGGTVTLSNTGVTSIVAGTNITVSGATGAVTINATASGVTSATAGTGIGVSGSTGAVTFTNTGVTSAVAGTGITVSNSTGAVTFGVAAATTSSLGAVQPDGTTIGISAGVISSITATPTTVTTPSAITVAMNGPGMYIYTPSTNANVTITLGSFQAGRIVRMFITPQAGGQTFTFTGITTAQNSLQKTTVKCIGPGIGGNIIAEIFCTTSAIGGIYINFINAQ